jgi:glutamate-1-semialdehyde 2,1-aminomutase
MFNIEKSLAMQKHARQRIPGMTQLLSKRPDMFSYGVWPGYYSKAQGVNVWDLDGNKYIDMSIAGIGANILGYCDPDVNEAVTKAITDGNSCSLNCAEEVELADLLCELHPWAEMCRFSRTGGEALAIAVRIARAKSGKEKIAFCGYHGWHDWYVAANLGTENALGDHLISGISPKGVPSGLTGTALPFHYNHLEELEKIVATNKDEIGVIVMEPMKNDDPEPGFLEGVRNIADEIGAVLIFDEVSAGFRLNSGGSHLRFDTTPDIAVFAKAISNGYAQSAVIGKGEVMQAAQSTFISSTYWTERVGPVAALATIKKHINLNVSDHLIKIGGLVQEGWRKLAVKNGLDISIGGMKPVSHFIFSSDQEPVLKAYFIQLMMEQGFLASNIFFSMYAHTEQHVEVYLDAVDQSFQEIARACFENDIQDRLIGIPATIGFKRLN